jgi:hypothetical protein
MIDNRARWLAELVTLLFYTEHSQLVHILFRVHHHRTIQRCTGCQDTHSILKYSTKETKLQFISSLFTHTGCPRRNYAYKVSQEESQYFVKSQYRSF